MVADGTSSACCKRKYRPTRPALGRPTSQWETLRLCALFTVLPKVVGVRLVAQLAVQVLSSRWTSMWLVSLAWIAGGKQVEVTSNYTLLETLDTMADCFIMRFRAPFLTGAYAKKSFTGNPHESRLLCARLSSRIYTPTCTHTVQSASTFQSSLPTDPCWLLRSMPARWLWLMLVSPCLDYSLDARRE